MNWEGDEDSGRDVNVNWLFSQYHPENSTCISVHLVS